MYDIYLLLVELFWCPVFIANLSKAKRLFVFLFVVVVVVVVVVCSLYSFAKCILRQIQHTREVISVRNTYHKYSNKDLSRLR